MWRIDEKPNNKEKTKLKVIMKVRNLRNSSLSHLRSSLFKKILHIKQTWKFGKIKLQGIWLNAFKKNKLKENLKIW